MLVSFTRGAIKRRCLVGVLLAAASFTALTASSVQAASLAYCNKHVQVSQRCFGDAVVRLPYRTNEVSSPNGNVLVCQGMNDINGNTRSGSSCSTGTSYVYKCYPTTSTNWRAWGSWTVSGGGAPANTNRVDGFATTNAC